MQAGDRIDARDDTTLEAALACLGPWIERLLAPRATGVEHLCAPGPALVVANHSGGQLAMFEPLVLAHAMQHAGAGPLPTVLVHDVMWRTPLATWLERAGAVRASQANADALLSAGRRLLVYPGGDREVFRPFTHRDRIELGDRRGYVKLAITHGVPIVPVVTSGVQSGLVCLTDGHALAARLPLAKKLRVGVLPITLSFPFGISIGVPAPYVPLVSSVRLRALPAIHLPRTGPEAAKDSAYVEACHEHVRVTMQVALDALADERRAGRRREIHQRLDRALSFFERLTLLPREGAPIAPFPHVSRPRPSLVPSRPSDAAPAPLSKAA